MSSRHKYLDDQDDEMDDCAWRSCCCIGTRRVVTQQPGNQAIGRMSGRETSTEYDRRIRQLEEWCRQKDASCTKLKHQCEELRERDMQKDGLYRQRGQENKMLRDRNMRYDTSYKQLQQENEELRNSFQVKVQENAGLRKEIDDLLLRLSSNMSAKLVDNNPNISDLSDENRPVKLGEMHNELYDNSWTDTFDALTNSGNLSDKAAIDLLLNLYLEINGKCKQKADADMKTMEGVVKKYSAGNQQLVLLKQMKDGRKKNYKADLKEINSAMLEEIVGRAEFVKVPKEKMRGYVQECMKLCWLMAVQDPPVCLVDGRSTKGKPFDLNLYKYYMSTGDYMEYLVWPALLLHQNGCVLSKGVAQGTATATVAIEQ